MSPQSSISCANLSAKDVCTLREKMLDPNCKLESFSLKVNHKMMRDFIQEAFGVTYEHSIVDGRMHKIYRTTNESVELYRVYGDIHLEGDFKTTITLDTIVFEYGYGGPKPDEKTKVKLNQPIFWF
ncbi:hypothetical protein PENTCL1PPCAC_15227 [Pristionchus entomophagus]|uniref:Lipocalin/cytosolic fatty-acid binding domain-containing protein n=1 Tax=Pristionchus entomophagus TaxID=358040 RepID=A0AAV5TDQ4_9BILA|nr:hypothetical protein PENTCL1PPCAC_15227 [Pristionchus entomophagus]